MNAKSLPKVLRDSLGRLPGDPQRRANLKKILSPAVLKLWDVGHTFEFTYEEIDTALVELVDEEVIRRLAEEFEQEQARQPFRSS
jgi:hypothetical protein